jgi:hypothetical protein
MTWETNESQVLPLFAATDRHRNCVGSPIQFSTCRSALGGRLKGSRRCRWMERSQQGDRQAPRKTRPGRRQTVARRWPLGQLVLRALVFGLREGLETVVMLRAIALFLVHRGRRHQLRSVWIASSAAAARCLVIACISGSPFPERSDEHHQRQRGQSPDPGLGEGTRRPGLLRASPGASPARRQRAVSSTPERGRTSSRTDRSTRQLLALRRRICQSAVTGLWQ